MSKGENEPSIFLSKGETEPSIFLSKSENEPSIFFDTLDPGKPLIKGFWGLLRAFEGFSYTFDFWVKNSNENFCLILIY